MIQTFQVIPQGGLEGLFYVEPPAAPMAFMILSGLSPTE